MKYSKNNALIIFAVFAIAAVAEISFSLEVISNSRISDGTLFLDVETDLRAECRLVALFIQGREILELDTADSIRHSKQIELSRFGDNGEFSVICLNKENIQDSERIELKLPEGAIESGEVLEPPERAPSPADEEFQSFVILIIIIFVIVLVGVVAVLFAIILIRQNKKQKDIKKILKKNEQIAPEDLKRIMPPEKPGTASHAAKKEENRKKTNEQKEHAAEKDKEDGPDFSIFERFDEKKEAPEKSKGDEGQDELWIDLSNGSFIQSHKVLTGLKESYKISPQEHKKNIEDVGNELIRLMKNGYIKQAVRAMKELVDLGLAEDAIKSISMKKEKEFKKKIVALIFKIHEKGIIGAKQAAKWVELLV